MPIIKHLNNSIQNLQQNRWLEKLITSNSRQPILFLSNSEDFLLALLSCWRLGLVPFIPADIQSENLLKMRALGGDVLLDDSTVLEPLSSGQVAFHEVALSDTALQLFTSGSTGQRKRVRKSFAQLLNEVGNLEQTWGNQVQGRPIFSTVSHQHIYGLLYTVLWPFLCKRPLAKSRVFHWDELPWDIATSTGLVLVSSPTSLKLLSKTKQTGKWNNSLIFSSGGHLRFEDAAAVTEKTQCCPFEVYGSTEMGGIAWKRQHHGASDLWTPFPRVVLRVSESHELEVQSPWTEKADPESTGDKAELSNASQFKLLGRVDRIVKIFEKRVNLDEMERLCRELPWVGDIRFTVPANPDGSGLLWCALEPIPSHSHLPRAEIIAEVQSKLSLQFERSIRPRFWYIGPIPYNAQSKLDWERVHSAGLKQSHPLDPEFSLLSHNDTTLEVQVVVPKRYFYLLGHFPNVPVVPGICQINWVAQLVRQYWDLDLNSLCGKIKFHGLLPIQKPVSIHLSRKPNQVHFRMSNGEKTFSSGSFRLEQI